MDQTRGGMMAKPKKPKKGPSNSKKPANGDGTSPKRKLSFKELVKIYPSLGEGSTPAQRLKKLLKEARARGYKPRSPQEREKWIEENRGLLWRDDDEIDEFIAWVRRGREQGHYD
jgi:hypothetical protein